jgi:hypothetical protein
LNAPNTKSLNGIKNFGMELVLSKNMNKQIKLIVRILLSLILVSGIILTKRAFGSSWGTLHDGHDDVSELPGMIHNHPPVRHAPHPLPAREARNTITQTIYHKHKTAIDWWVKYINKRIDVESNNENASVSIDVTKASIDVQAYLEMVYVGAGYDVRLMQTWNSALRVPENPIYLGLSW